MPPTLGAAIASCMVLRCISPILRPERIAKAPATVTTPKPPIWISSRMTSCPNADQ